MNSATTNRQQMEKIFTEEKTFTKENFTQTPLAKGEYDHCTFAGCDFSNSDLSGNKFIECTFNGCNLSMVKLMKTSFINVIFKDCKMLGLHFENCNPFGLSFSVDGCLLNLSSFYKTNLKKTIFRNSQLQEVDFSECDLSGSVFDRCDFLRATFDHTILEKADLRTSLNYSIDPENNRIKKAKFSLTGAAGLLDKYDIEIDLAN